jgi:hypothetical protein
MNSLGHPKANLEGRLSDFHSSPVPRLRVCRSPRLLFPSTQNKIMKTKLVICSLLSTVSLLAGCISKGNTNIIASKSTTFGFDVSGDPQTSVPHVRMGLIRNFYQVIVPASFMKERYCGNPGRRKPEEFSRYF